MYSIDQELLVAMFQEMFSQEIKFFQASALQMFYEEGGTQCILWQTVKLNFVFKETPQGAFKYLKLFYLMQLLWYFFFFTYYDIYTIIWT